MNVVWLLSMLFGIPAAQAAWVQAGPERGHVLHAAVGPQQVSVATRVGVVSAGLELEGWARDPRFPPETRRLAYGPDGVAWAAPMGQIWRVGEGAERVAFYRSATSPVDLAVTGSGALVAALRGEEAGVLRVGPSGEPERVLEGVEPWRVAAAGERVLLGTVGEGVWLSTDDGHSFERILDTQVGVSAVAWIEDRAWVGLADGGIRVHDGSWRELPAPRSGYVNGFAASPDGVLATVQRLGHGHDALLLIDPEGQRELEPGRVGGDATMADLTGAWTLPDGRALVGSFRRGPLVYDAAGLRPARAGFRATVSGGAAMDASGRLVIALMGTGVYVSTDQGRSWEAPRAGDGPVTDSVAVVPHGDNMLVVDFEGVTLLDADGQWRRLPRNPLLQPGEHFASVAYDADDRLWGVDRRGTLYLLQDGAWRACQQKGVRLEGSGEQLLLSTFGGFRSPGACDAGWPLIQLDTDPTLDGRRARAAGQWVAGAGAVWKGGKKRFSIPLASVAALAARDDQALVALDDGRIYRCSEACEPLPEPVPGIVSALGWLGDGRVWVAELTGTFLIEGEALPLPSWSDVENARRVTGDLNSLERAPWNSEAQPQPQPGDPGPQQPQPGQPAPGQPAPQPQPGVQAQPAVQPEPVPEAACGCASGRAGGGALLLALLGLFGLRRRA